MTQKIAVLGELMTGSCLSRREIRDNFNINSETEVIRQLRADGNNIRVLWKKSKQGKRYVKYYLVHPDVRRVF